MTDRQRAMRNRFAACVALIVAGLWIDTWFVAAGDRHDTPIGLTGVSWCDANDDGRCEDLSFGHQKVVRAPPCIYFPAERVQRLHFGLYLWVMLAAGALVLALTVVVVPRALRVLSYFALPGAVFALLVMAYWLSTPILWSFPLVWSAGLIPAGLLGIVATSVGTLRSWKPPVLAPAIVR